MKRKQISGRPEVVVAHDYVTQRGGAERVTLELVRALDPAYLVTSLYSPDDTFPSFRDIDIRVSFLNRIPLFRKYSRLALPLLPASWSMRRPVDARVVVCSSSGWAHGLPVAPGTRKVVYCHNPPRWLYQPEDYLMGCSGTVRQVMKVLRPMLLDWDQRAAASADVYIANSTSVAQRIRRFYSLEPEIVFPPVSVDTLGATEPVADVTLPFFLTIGRARRYKGTHLLAEAFRRLPDHRLVVVGASALGDCPANVKPIGFISDAQLRWLYANARGLVSVSREDFGLTPIEANAFGTPGLLLRAGGFLDSANEGVSGLFIEDASTDSIVSAVSSFPEHWDRQRIIRHAARFSPENFRSRIRQIIEGVR